MSHDNRYVKGSNAGYNLGLTFDFSFCIFYAVSNIVFRFEFEKTFALYFSTGLISGFFLLIISLSEEYSRFSLRN